MRKPAKQLEVGDLIELAPDGKRVLCAVTRPSERVWMPLGVTTFWVQEQESRDLHLVSCAPEYLFDMIKQEEE